MLYPLWSFRILNMMFSNRSLFQKKKEYDVFEHLILFNQCPVTTVEVHIGQPRTPKVLRMYKCKTLCTQKTLYRTQLRFFKLCVWGSVRVRSILELFYA